jgi:formamidopyrimidine-DNA glycosylase
VPEGHILHRLAGEQQELVGSPLAVTSPQGRFAEGAARLDGRVLDGVEAVGKHLLHRFGDEALHVHLGMRGVFHRSAPPSPEPRPSVRVRLAAPTAAWDLIAPTTCEVLDGAGVSTLRDRLGPDPLRDDADPERFVAALLGNRRALGVSLLDQVVIAGVGNVFRAEALFACRLHPGRASSSVSAQEARALWDTLQGMMRRGVEDGRIITVDVPTGDDRLDVPEEVARRVYKRERCAECRAEVVTWPLGGRVAYACPVQQPLEAA